MRTEQRFLWILFAVIFAAEFALGFYISFIIGYMHSDAMSRVANAFYVLFSRDPHLAAIGFVWNPLPSFLSMILLLLYPLFPALASHGLAGIIVSSIFAGLTSALLYRAGRRFELPRWLALSISLLYSLNPFIFLFGANGLSDAPYIFFIVYALISFTYWMDNQQPGNMVKAAFALALAFWTRYEAVPLGVAFALGSAVVILSAVKNRNCESNQLREKLQKIEGTWITLLLPAVFSGLLWLFFNYTIMGNVFYFLSSEYSNVAQSESLKGDTHFQQIFSSPMLAFLLCAKKTLWFSAPLAGIAIIRILNKRLFQWDIVALLLVFCSIPGLQFALLMKSASFAWFRYFMYVYPITVAWLPYELSKVKRNVLNCTTVMISLLLSVTVLSYALTNPSIAPDEHTFLTINEGRHFKSIKLDRSVAQWIDEHLPNDVTVLTDSAAAYMILVNSRFPKKYLITSDFDFRAAVNDPPGQNIDYILLPKAPVYSTINTKHPEMFASGNDWATLYKNFEDSTHSYEWRLYKVKKWEGSRVQ